MKKFLTTFLFVCSCTLIAAAVGCNDKEPVSSSSSSSSSSEEIVYGDDRAVTFERGEGYTFTSNVENGVLAEGKTLTFTVELGAFYTGEPVAYVNGIPLAPNADGEYAYKVGAEDITVRVTDVIKDVSNMQGSGTMDDAYVVTKPIDLIHIANKVNSGDRQWASAAYILGADIDCKGEELEIIGDYSTPQSVFSGSFACMTNSETGEMTRHTISNFKINSENDNYVGLFGAVFADASLESSALFYGILLDNFEITAGASQITDANKTITCGALMGYGVGVNLYLCDATNGTIYLQADQNYFSYVGGLVGYQQGFYDMTYGNYFPTEISYSKVDVDVHVLGGVALYGGGITGYTLTNYPFGATAAIHNSYALGSVSGALRSGGVVGGLGQYTSVSNCYSAGEISARSYQEEGSDFTAPEYHYAYAGGIVGYAENDTIINDCFFNGKASAYTVSSEHYSISNPFIGSGDAAGTVSVNSERYLAENCLENVDLNSDAINAQLKWEDYNWVLKKGELPTINYEQTEGTVQNTLTLKYVSPKDKAAVLLNGKSEVTLDFFDTSMSSLNSYNPLGSFMGSGSLALYQKADNGYLSYGYFFDEACTQRVPYSYIPMKNITLYVGFADPTPILGSYQLSVDGSTEPLKITFEDDHVVRYSDGATDLNATYFFDGERIIVEGARLARYYQGEIVIDDTDTTLINDPNFELYRYDFYNFEGAFVNGVLRLYDGKYFTKDAPLTGSKELLRGDFYVTDANGTTYYTFYGHTAFVETVPNKGATVTAEYDGVSVNGNVVTLSDSTGIYQTITVAKDTLSSYDSFKGSWVKSATFNKVYTFDGVNGWSYTYMGLDGKTRLDSDKGSYTLGEDKKSLTFTQDGVTYTATFNSDGFLELSSTNGKQLYYANGSYTGTWKGGHYDITLYGISSEGYGKAVVLRNDGFVTDLLYETVTMPSGVYLVFYSVLEDAQIMKDSVFGYATLSYGSTLQFTLPDVSDSSETGYVTDTLRLYDDYYGEWIWGLDGLENLEFSFDGMGLYGGKLTLTVGDTTTVTDYSLEADHSTRFSYKGVTYVLSLNEDKKEVQVTLPSDETTLERKDEFANAQFVDDDNNEYVFDGRSTLLSGGTLTVDDKKYTYFLGATDYVVKENGTEVGSIQKTDTHYLLTVNGVETKLYLKNEFMGDWAINTQYSLFHIGPTDLEGKIKATFKDKDVTITQIDPTTLTFDYQEGRMPITYYVFVQTHEKTGEKVLILSEADVLGMGDYVVCSKIDELFGVWEWNFDNGKTTLKMDGASSGFATGNAELRYQMEHKLVVTEYSYAIRDKGIVLWSKDTMWSNETMSERTWYFRLDMIDFATAEKEDQDQAYVLRDEGGNVVKAMLRTQVDGLYLVEAKDGEQNAYFFDGTGKLYVNDEHVYDYKVKSYNSDSTATMEVTDVKTGTVYAATLNYADAENYLFVLGDEIVEEA